MKNIDFLAIGDIATEPFIKIKEAEAICDKGGDHCKLCLNYGGKIPYESALVCSAVGNSANAAISASRLGLNASIVTYVGNDDIGKKNIEELIKQDIDTRYVSIIDGMESNYHYVLWYGVERTILVKHINFPYAFPKDLPEPKWIYLSSLASNSIEYHNEIKEYLDVHPRVSLAFSPGTFQIKLGLDILKNIYLNTKIFLCNNLEAQTILKTDESNISKLLKMLSELGPKIVVITNGLKGAYSYDGKDIYYMEAINMIPVESTGAGDAFASAFVTAISIGKDIPEALIWGSVNAMSVVSYVGPHEGLLIRNQIEEYIKNLSDDYKPIKI